MTPAPIRVAVDAMGGDFAPEEVVLGAVRAADRDGVEILLVGPAPRVEVELRRHRTAGLSITVVDSDDTISESERPVQALLRRPNAGIAVCAQLVRRGMADALVGAGNSGAVLVASARHVGCLDGVSRASIATSFPLAPQRLLLDIGANVDCKPEHLVGFAALGVAYARTVLNVLQPSVGLLSIGAEESKGSLQIREAHQLLKKSGLNFVGNVEGTQILEGKADVVVCDGVTGNAILKFAEGYSQLILKQMDSALGSAGIELPAALGALYRGLERSADLTIGGEAGVLLGLRKVCMICHGRSRAWEIEKSIEKVCVAVERDLVGAMGRELRQVASSRADLQGA